MVTLCILADYQRWLKAEEERLRIELLHLEAQQNPFYLPTKSPNPTINGQTKAEFKTPKFDKKPLPQDLPVPRLTSDGTAACVQSDRINQMDVAPLFEAQSLANELALKDYCHVSKQTDVVSNHYSMPGAMETCKTVSKVDEHEMRDEVQKNDTWVAQPALNEGAEPLVIDEDEVAESDQKYFVESASYDVTGSGSVVQIETAHVKPESNQYAELTQDVFTDGQEAESDSKNVIEPATNDVAGSGSTVQFEPAHVKDLVELEVIQTSDFTKNAFTVDEDTNSKNGIEPASSDVAGPGINDLVEPDNTKDLAEGYEKDVAGPALKDAGIPDVKLFQEPDAKDEFEPELNEAAPTASTNVVEPHVKYVTQFVDTDVVETDVKLIEEPDAETQIELSSDEEAPPAFTDVYEPYVDVVEPHEQDITGTESKNIADLNAKHVSVPTLEGLYDTTSQHISESELKDLNLSGPTDVADTDFELVAVADVEDNTVHYSNLGEPDQKDAQPDSAEVAKHDLKDVDGPSATDMACHLAIALVQSPTQEFTGPEAKEYAGIANADPAANDITEPEPSDVAEFVSKKAPFTPEQLLLIADAVHEEAKPIVPQTIHHSEKHKEPKVFSEGEQIRTVRFAEIAITNDSLSFKIL